MKNVAGKRTEIGEEREGEKEMRLKTQRRREGEGRRGESKG